MTKKLTEWTILLVIDDLIPGHFVIISIFCLGQLLVRHLVFTEILSYLFIAEFWLYHSRCCRGNAIRLLRAEFLHSMQFSRAFCLYGFKLEAKSGKYSWADELHWNLKSHVFCRDRFFCCLEIQEFLQCLLNLTYSKCAFLLYIYY